MHENPARTTASSGDQPRLRVGVIGAGMMGLTLARLLARSPRLELTVLEQRSTIGGLSRPVEITPGIWWDQYYHVILTSDAELLELVRELGLADQLVVRQTKTGFFMDGGLHSFSSAWEFLWFPPLTLVDKLRLGAGILYASRLSDPRRLAHEPADRWLVAVFGQRLYHRIWAPLLRSKLGTASDQASAAFICATIRRYYGTRHSANSKEQMAYVRGGYRAILERLHTALIQSDVTVRTACPVQRIERPGPGEVLVTLHSGEQLRFDRVVATIPGPLLEPLIPDLPQPLRDRLQDIRYLGLVCLLLLLRRPLGPFYVTNLADEGLPFTGVIECTALVDPADLGGHFLVYLPRYLAPGDNYGDRPDEEIRQEFVAALRRIHPTLRDEEIVTWSIGREQQEQPLQDQGYAARIPPVDLHVPEIQLINNSMILDSTLNNNQVVGLARRFADAFLEKIQADR